MILPFEIPQLDIPNVGRNHIIQFFLVAVRKIISEQEIYLHSLFHSEPVNALSTISIFMNQFV